MGNYFTELIIRLHDLKIRKNAGEPISNEEIWELERRISEERLKSEITHAETDEMDGLNTAANEGDKLPGQILPARRK